MYTILIIDADENSRRLCGRHFELDGYQVIVAGSKDDVAEGAEDQRIDLVVMDLNVPELDVTHYLTNFWNRDVPVIMHTATAELPDEIPFWLPEAWLRKTGDIEGLKAVVAEALRRQEERETATFSEPVPTFPCELDWHLFGDVADS